MITPTPGRIVWFFPSLEAGRDPNGQPLAAILAKVISERCVNLTVSHGDGTTYAAQNVQLLQDDDAVPETAYACWMPFQKGQAAKHDAAATAPADLQPLHAAIAQVAEKADAALAAPEAAIAAAVEPMHAKIALAETATQTKFEELGKWLTDMFTGFEQKLEALKNQAPPAPPQPPV